MSVERSLTPRQARFVEEYLVDLNATQAAVRSGYSPRTALQQGPRLLTYPAVVTAIAERKAVRSERVGFTAEEVLKELALLVKSDVRDFTMDEKTGELALRAGVPDEAWRSVASVKRRVRIVPQKDGEPIIERDMEVRLWDKNAAIEKAMKHLGMFHSDGEPPATVPVGGLTINFNFVQEGRRYDEAAVQSVRP